MNPANINDTAARIIIYILIGIGVAYDILALIRNWPTISQTVRVLDRETGSLLRWALFALWMHFFILKPWGGW